MDAISTTTRGDGSPGSDFFPLRKCGSPLVRGIARAAAHHADDGADDDDHHHDAHHHDASARTQRAAAGQHHGDRPVGERRIGQSR
jgi:hypothetical protein